MSVIILSIKNNFYIVTGDGLCSSFTTDESSVSNEIVGNGQLFCTSNGVAKITMKYASKNTNAGEKKEHIQIAGCGICPQSELSFFLKYILILLLFKLCPLTLVTSCVLLHS